MKIDVCTDPTRAVKTEEHLPIDNDSTYDVSFVEYIIGIDIRYTHLENQCPGILFSLTERVIFIQIV